MRLLIVSDLMGGGNAVLHGKIYHDHNTTQSQHHRHIGTGQVIGQIDHWAAQGIAQSVFVDLFSVS